MRIGPIVQVTMLSSNLDAVAELYKSAFDWQISKPKYQISLADATRWSATDLAGAPAIEISGINGGLRLIEVPKFQPPEPLKSFGWTALEICVDDVYGYTERAIAAGFKLLNEPVPLSGQAKLLPLIAAQLAGINGEVIYITQILDEVPNFELPDVNRESGSIFICVLGASDLEKSRSAIESAFEVRRASDREVAIKVLNKVFERSLDDRHRISSLQLAGRNAIEIDQLPNEADARAKIVGNLVGGISMVTVKGDVGEPQIFELPDNAILEII